MFSTSKYFSVPELTDPSPLWLPTREERQTSKCDDLFTATPIVPNQQEIVNETPEDMFQLFQKD